MYIRFSIKIKDTIDTELWIQVTITNIYIYCILSNAWLWLVYTIKHFFILCTRMYKYMYLSVRFILNLCNTYLLIAIAFCNYIQYNQNNLIFFLSSFAFLHVPLTYFLKIYTLYLIIYQSINMRYIKITNGNKLFLSSGLSFHMFEIFEACTLDG